MLSSGPPCEEQGGGPAQTADGEEEQVNLGNSVPYYSLAEAAWQLGISTSAIAKAVERAERREVH